MILEWSSGALASYGAIRGRVQDDGRIFLNELVSGLVLDTPPNQSLLGRVLRDPNFFLAMGKVSATRQDVVNERAPWNQFSVFALQIERFAEQERVRTVGERHIAKLLVELGRNNTFSGLGLNPQLVYEEVRRLELGPDFTDDELRGWHGLIDTNVVLKSRKKAWEIDWREVSNSPKGEPVTIWISTVTLHELDMLPLHARDGDIKQKARAFSSWFNQRVRGPEDLRGIPLGNDMRFKFWKALPAITPDTQILDSANSLRDRRVPLIIVTHDNDLRMRAIDDGFEVADLPKSLLLADPPPTAQQLPVMSGT